MKKLDTQSPNFQAELKALLAFETAQNPEIDRIVADICADVQKRGDAALIEYTNRFDGTSAQTIDDLILTQDDLQSAFERLPENIQTALKTAARRVESYHKHQKMESWTYEDEDGTLLGQQITPLDRVGIYVPGGKAAYPSSVIMNAMPAHVAGVKEIIMVVPTPKGERNDIVLAAAFVAGVTKVFTVGGAQAVAALAYGTESVPQVDKITGPGNAFVAAAKRRVFGVVGIDMVAGPSEILVIADGTTPADWVAMDLFSQAEHDEIAQAILIGTSQAYLDEVQTAMNRLIETMPRRAIIEASLGNRGAMIWPKIWTKPVKSPTIFLPNTWNCRSKIRKSGRKKSAMQVRFSWDAIPVKAWVTIVQAPTTFCRPAARRVSLLLWEHMTSKNAPV